MIYPPACDAMLSHAGTSIGIGWVFGLHEALDQCGAMMGPLIVAVVFYFDGNYEKSFAILAIPALLALVTLLFVFKFYPHLYHLEIKTKKLESKGMKKPFWIYFLGAGLVAAGFADFAIISFHYTIFSHSLVLLG